MSNIIPAGHSVIESIANENVSHAFGLLGHANLSILDGFYDRKFPEFIGCRHEQGAILMADGYARASGKPGVCIATCGPGATNLATGIAQAYEAQSPVVTIAGGIPESYTFREGFQELDLVSILKPLTKFSGRLTDMERIPELMQHIFRIATNGKKGPVYLELPEDKLLNSQIDYEPVPPEEYRLVDTKPVGDAKAIELAINIMTKAKKPIVIAGGGVVSGNATDNTIKLAESLGAGLMTSYGRNDALPYDNPLFLGSLGRGGSIEAIEAIQECDVLIALGSRLSQMTGSMGDNKYIPKSTKIIQIEIDSKEIGRNYLVSAGILGDAHAVSAKFLEILKEKIKYTHKNQNWQDKIKELVAKRHARLNSEGQSTSSPIKPQKVYHELRKSMPKNSIYTLDAGAVCAMGYDRLDFTENKTFFSPLFLGSLGVGYPVAIGAKVARPNSPVMAIHGDGGYLFNSQELQTAVDYNINVITLIMNNNCWGGEKKIQDALFEGRHVGSYINNPRYDKYAEVFGAKGFYAETSDQISDAINEAINCNKPSIIEIPVDPEELGKDVKL